MREKVLVAMSGGVDSSVASFLLKKSGFEVTGVTMCFGANAEGDGERPRCCGPDAIEDAKRVCRKLDIPHHIFDFSLNLKKYVIEKFVSEYIKGKTPNPCIECNRFLKFEILFKKARAMGFDFLATGHYAKITNIRGSFFLKRPKDKKKDQTYFLYPIKKDILESIKFPLQGLTKERVREIAKKVQIPVADKPQSQDICFIPKGDYRMFILERIKNTAPGDIVDKKGNVLGTHRGISSYTIGQRKGLNVSHTCPLYVVSVDAEKNKVVVGEKGDLKSKSFIAGNVNILVDNLPKKAFAKIRYKEKEAECNISNEDTKIKVTFKKPQEAITPGQSVVFYDKSTVLGGAIIEKVLNGQ